MMRILNTIWLGLGSGDSESILADGPEPRPSLNHASSANDNLPQFEFCLACDPVASQTCLTPQTNCLLCSASYGWLIRATGKYSIFR